MFVFRSSVFLPPIRIPRPTMPLVNGNGIINFQRAKISVNPFFEVYNFEEKDLEDFFKVTMPFLCADILVVCVH